MRHYRRQDDILRATAGSSLSLEEMRQRLPAIFAEGAHSSRSDRYVYIPTHDILSEIMKAGFVPVEARVTHARSDDRKAHAKHMVRLRQVGGEPKARAVGDTHFEVIMRNAHDGSAAYDFMAGLFRLACLNGMVVSAGNIGSAHVRHSGNREKQIGQVIDAVYSVVQDAPKVLEAPRLWSTIDLSRDEQHAMADAARVIRFGDAEGKVESPIKASQLLNARRPDDNRSDLWTTFNRIQENSVRGGLSAWGRDAHGHSRRVSSREVRGIDGDIKLNKALWQLGTKMAELKLA